jgi:hypothetical protein
VNLVNKERKLNEVKKISFIDPTNEKKSKRFCYDDAAIAKLLDRNQESNILEGTDGKEYGKMFQSHNEISFDEFPFQ